MERNTKPKHRRLESFGAAGLFGLMSALLTWPRLPGAANSVVDYGDPLIDIWRLRWIGNSFFSNFSGLFDAPIFQGYPKPLAYDNIITGPALLAFPISKITGSIELAYNLILVASFAAIAWCVFLLARHITGSATAGLIAGTAVGFWSYPFAHISHLTELSSYAIPLALLCLHRLFEAPTPGIDIEADTATISSKHTFGPVWWTAGFFACFAWQTLNSFYFAAYLGLAAGAFILWEGLVVRSWRGWDTWQRCSIALLLVVSLLLSGAMLALVSAPYREVQAQLSLYRTAEEQVAWSAHLTDYLSVSPRNQTYKGLLPNVWPEPLFPGFATLVLGIVGLASLFYPKRHVQLGTTVTDRSRTRRSLGFYAVMSAGALLLSLGTVWRLGNIDVPLPYAALSGLPGFNALRAPGRLATVAVLGWGVLAGWGWLRLWAAGRTLSARQPQLKAVFALVLIVLMPIEQWTVPTPTAPLPPKRAHSLLSQGKVPPAYEWLATQHDNGVLAEFPISTDAAGTYIRMYYQGIHGHKLMNGHSSFVPPLYPELARRLDEPVEMGREGIGILQSLDVRYLSFYQWAYKKDHWKRKMDSLKAFPEVRVAGDFDEDTVLTLAPLSDNAIMRLGWRVLPSLPAGSTVPITISLVNVYNYPLLTRLNTSLPLSIRWQEQAEGGPATKPLVIDTSLEVPLLLEQGAHLFTLPITTPSKPGRYLLDIGAAWPLPRYKTAAPSPVLIGP